MGLWTWSGWAAVSHPLQWGTGQVTSDCTRSLHVQDGVALCASQQGASPLHGAWLQEPIPEQDLAAWIATVTWSLVKIPQGLVRP